MRLFKTWKNRTVRLITFLASLASIIGLYLMLANNDVETLQLTVFVVDKDGNVAIENEGRLNIPIGHRILNEQIGKNGRTIFAEIPKKHLGDTLRVGLEVEGWKIRGSNYFVFDGKPKEIEIERDGSLGWITGFVKTSNHNNGIASAIVLINTDTIVKTDSLGIFRILLPENMRIKKSNERYLLTVSAKGYQTKYEYFTPGSSDLPIVLDEISDDG